MSRHQQRAGRQASRRAPLPPALHRSPCAANGRPARERRRGLAAQRAHELAGAPSQIADQPAHVAEARSELAGRLDGVPAGEAGTLGAELYGVATLLRREPALRRVATDASIEGDAKAGLVESVLGNAVGGATLDLVKDAVRRRWTSPRDLADVLEQLGTVAAVRSGIGAASSWSSASTT